MRMTNSSQIQITVLFVFPLFLQFAGIWTPFEDENGFPPSQTDEKVIQVKTIQHTPQLVFRI